MLFQNKIKRRKEKDLGDVRNQNKYKKSIEDASPLYQNYTTIAILKHKPINHRLTVKSLILEHLIPKLKCFSSRRTVVLVQYTDAMC